MVASSLENFHITRSLDFTIQGMMSRQRRKAQRMHERADEILLCSTPFCVLPVTRIGESTVGDGRAGPIFGMLLGAFSELVGLDIAGQARRFAGRT